MGQFILKIPWNREQPLFRPTQELTEDIPSILSLLSTATNTVINQDGIQDAEEKDDDGDSTMTGITDFESGSHV